MNGEPLFVRVSRSASKAFVITLIFGLGVAVIFGVQYLVSNSSDAGLSGMAVVYISVISVPTAFIVSLITAVISYIRGKIK